MAAVKWECRGMDWESGQGLDHRGHPVGPLLDIILGESLNRGKNAHTWNLWHCPCGSELANLRPAAVKQG